MSVLTLATDAPGGTRPTLSQVEEEANRTGIAANIAEHTSPTTYTLVQLI